VQWWLFAGLPVGCVRLLLQGDQKGFQKLEDNHMQLPIERSAKGLQAAGNAKAPPARGTLARLARRAWFYRWVYLLILPGLLYFIIFHYIPMWGIIVAFEDFHPWTGILKSPWVGLDNFRFFFHSPYFVRLVRNTITISLLDLAFVFPAPIILALLLNEVKANWFKRIIQTVSYLPNFISWVVVGGLLIYTFSVNIGSVNILLAQLNAAPLKVLGNPQAFLALVVGTGVWKTVGYNSIIFLAAITSINPEFYEAAMVDGAGRFERMKSITLPGITSVIAIMLVLRLGAILSVNFQQILILLGDNASLFQVGDVIQTWVYRTGFYQFNFGLATAVGILQGGFALVLVWLANRAANALTGSGIW
jgi:putative aldouronate transport system permease protein